MRATCQLCKNNKELVRGHIAPRFVWRWLKDTSPGGIRTTEVPNRLAQDGPKMPLFCSDCECSISEWEREFCEGLFLAIHSPSRNHAPLSYGSYALKFAVSASWRTLMFIDSRGPSSLSREDQQLARQARETWRRFLLDDLDHPGDFEQHLLPAAVIQDPRLREISPNINRYLARAIDLDVVSSANIAYVFTKLGRVMIFGMIRNDRPRQWRGTRIHVRKGQFTSRIYKIQPRFLSYLSRKADKLAAVHAKLSPVQKKRISETIRRNAEDVAVSEAFEAMCHDVLLSGPDAFVPEEDA